MTDTQEKDGVMIALLPRESEWSTLELPHLTLVYCGTKDKLKPTDLNSLIKDANSLAMLCGPFHLIGMGVDIFGDEEKVKVLRLRPTPELAAMRRYVESWNKSEHPFNPHVTSGPADAFVETLVPTMVYFDRMCVSYGEDNIIFSLR